MKLLLVACWVPEEQQVGFEVLGCPHSVTLQTKNPQAWEAASVCNESWLSTSAHNTGMK